jgi:hypothetical protein
LGQTGKMRGREDGRGHGKFLSVFDFSQLPRVGSTWRKKTAVRGHTNTVHSTSWHPMIGRTREERRPDDTGDSDHNK